MLRRGCAGGGAANRGAVFAGYRRVRPGAAAGGEGRTVLFPAQRAVFGGNVSHCGSIGDAPVHSLCFGVCTDSPAAGAFSSAGDSCGLLLCGSGRIYPLGNPGGGDAVSLPSGPPVQAGVRSAVCFAFAVLVLLLGNPLTAASASFQLSVGAVAGILCFSSRLYAWMTRGLGKGRGFGRRVCRVLASSVAVSLGATVFTAPMAAWTFGVVSLLSPLTNLVSLWAVSLGFYGVLAACGLGAVWLPLGKGVARCTEPVLRLILGVGGWTGQAAPGQRLSGGKSLSGRLGGICPGDFGGVSFG